MNEDYRKAVKLAQRYRARMLSEGKDPYLSVLADVTDTAGLSMEPIGLLEVPTSLFVGTKDRGRQNAFAGNFLPLLSEDSEFAYKWSAVYDAQIAEGIRESVRCYEYKGEFYVAEGNKRVSVLKYLDVPTILSDVIRIYPKEKDPLYEEFLNFFRAARTYAIRFSIPGSYRKLAEHFSLSLKDVWPKETISRMLSGYRRFSAAFAEKAGELLQDHTGDAYLVYLSFYPAAQLPEVSMPLLKNRIARILPEFLTTVRDERKKLVETPEEVKRDKKIFETVMDLFSGTGPYSEKAPLHVAFLYRGDPAASAWLSGHDAGRAYVEESFGKILSVRTYRNYHTDEALARTIDQAVADGANVIFTVSGEDMRETLKAALHYPKTRFYNCSLNEHHRYVPTYYGKVYEVKFLLGALAAVYAKDHRIGYLADYPIYGTIASINAFAIGAAMIDPQVKVYLKWTTKENIDWRKELYEDGVAVISAHDITKPSWGKEELGLFYWTEEGERIHLARPRYHWGHYYELILQNILDGREPSGESDYAYNYWYGISSGVIDIELAEDLSYYSVKLISLLKEAIVSGDLDPFSSEIHSQAGAVQERNAPKLSNREIIHMNWLNDNIVGSLPKERDLQESARSIVRVSGVETVREE